MKKITLEGAKITNLEEFYNEIEKKLTKDLGWSIGRNLDAFNDVLRGGFGVHEYGESIALVWLDVTKSQAYLGHQERADYLQKRLDAGYPFNRESLREQLELAQQGKGPTIFELILEIIKEHKHIELILQ